MSWRAPEGVPHGGRGLRLLGFALALVVAGCGRGAPPPPPTPTPPSTAPEERPEEELPVPAPPETLAAPSPGYDGSSGYEPGIDTTPLRGRRIVLDAGHGGRWAGSLGVEGTREADVNLSVSHSLAGLLRDAGAEVHLTRLEDGDFRSPTDSSLAYDLKARAAFADSLEAEVFLSLHHNADAGSRHDVNETQTYYRRGDDGPSLDLAQDLHRRLVQSLRLDTARLRPGNYSVLRNTRAGAACLLEPSYLTYPPVESLLRDTTAIRLEAEAYFMGLLDYFERGTPSVTALGWDPQWTGPDAWRPVVARLSEEPLTLDWAIAGQRLPAARWTTRRTDGAYEAVLSPDEPWRDGALIAQVRARGAGGNHTPMRSETLSVDLPAAGLRLAAVPPGNATGPVALEIRALDAWDRPLDDTVRVGELRWWISGESIDVQRFQLNARWESPGVSRAYWTALPAVAWENLEVGWRGLRSNALSSDGVAGVRWRTGFVRSSDSTGVRGITVHATLGSGSARSDAAGFYALPGTATNLLDLPLVAEARGFQFLSAGADDTLWVAPVAGGLLLGRRIAIDPIGGGDDADGAAPGGSLGSPINLLAARQLRGLLEAAGADVRLLRSTESRRTDEERVELAEAFGAERVIRIGRRTGGPSAVGHFPGSSGGSRLATAIHERLAPREAGYAKAAELGRSREAILWEDASWVLQQTSCPAVSVRIGDFASTVGERRSRDPVWQVQEAYAVYAGLIEDFRQELPDSARPELVSVEVVFRDGNRALSGMLVRLGGSELLTDGNGVVRFAGLSPRHPHRLRVRFPDSSDEAIAWLDPATARLWAWEQSRSKPEALRRR